MTRTRSASSATPTEVPPKAPGQRKIAALDGLRTIAVATVIFHHLLPGNVLEGGVEVFFVLSGYLITTILLREHRETGRINIKVFLLRRLLRLYPALLVTTAIVSGVLLALGLRRFAVEQAAFALTYSFDLFIAVKHVAIGALGHAWSLSLEEQFYLTWPVVVLAVHRFTRGRWGGFAVVAALAALGVAGQFAFFVNQDNFSPQARVGAVLVGCALAYLLNARPMVLHRSWLWVAGAGFTLVCVLAGLTKSLPQIWVNPLVTMLAVLAVWVLATANDHHVGLLSNRVSVHLGTISYGLYLWHYPIIWFLTYYHVPLGARIAVALPATLVAAELSKKYVENPFLAMKDRLSGRGPASGRPLDTPVPSGSPLPASTASTPSTPSTNATAPALDG